MDIRLIASDLDGTFLADYTSASQINIQAVAAAQQAGIKFVIATGRPSRWLRDIKKLFLSQDTIAITSNGAQIILLHSGEILHTFALSKDLAENIIAEAKKLAPGIKAGFEHGETFSVEPDFGGFELGDGAEVHYAPWPQLLKTDKPITKLVLRHPNIDTETLYDLTRPAFSEATATYSYLSDAGLLEISAQGVSKAHSLQVLADSCNILAAQTAAFGDMPNDLEMLTWAGLGFVMPNAHLQLRQKDHLEQLSEYPDLAADPTEAVGKVIYRLLDDSDAADRKAKYRYD